MIKLSVCIATYNRAKFISETLDSIIPQLTSEVELLVVDGNSPDGTDVVMRDYTSRHPEVRYFRETENSGVDADYDKAVGYALGKYCWLMPDDDLLAPMAIARVLGVIEKNPDLIVVDAVVKDVTLAFTLKGNRLPFTGERHYTSANANQLMADVGETLSFIGATIIRRSHWLARNRERYFGTCFAHVGVIFQLPYLDKVIAIGEPLIVIRYGNSMWTPRRFEIWMFKWPELIWGFEGYSDQAKTALGPRLPWKVPKHLLSFRAKGGYSYHEYDRYFAGKRLGWWRLALLIIAVMPGRLAHLLGTIYLILKREGGGMGAYELLHCSPYSNLLSRWIVSSVAPVLARRTTP